MADDIVIDRWPKVLPIPLKTIVWSLYELFYITKAIIPSPKKFAVLFKMIQTYLYL